ncbi:MAG: arginine--tRNA ligase [Candidatus Woesearchaeota archaeon]
MEQFKQEVIKELEKVTKLEKNQLLSLLEIPDPKFGDFAFPTFVLAKSLKKNPNQIAQEFANKLKPTKIITKIQATGPYVNFFINPTATSTTILAQITKSKSKYGQGKKTNKTVLIEGWQPNTHKAFHIGHIRNAVLSESLARILEYQGNKVIRCAYMGDVGTHVAKWLWYFTKFHKGDIPNKNVTKWAGEIYTKATQLSQENPDYQKEIHELHSKLENGDKTLIKLWKKTRQLCLKDIMAILKELDSHVGRVYYESEVEQPGKKIVKELAAKGVAQYSDGAIILNLEHYNLGVFVLLKSNGASLYSTKDIALAYLKSKEFEFTTSLYVVGAEQDHHFRQLFKTLELIGYPDAAKVKHVSFGLVVLKEGKMSSRQGNIVLYEDFREQLFQQVAKQIASLALPEKEKAVIKKTVAFGAMKFTMLSQDAHKEIVFDPEQALSFEGETGPYIQYTHARISSILRKSEQPKKPNYSLLQEELEQRIVAQLALFPQKVQESAQHLKPNLIARYLIDLAQLFNEFYHKYPVLKAEIELRKARLVLCQATATVLKNGLALLSIEAPERM